MKFLSRMTRTAPVAAVALVVGIIGLSWSTSPAQEPPASGLTEPVYRVPNEVPAESAANIASSDAGEVVHTAGQQPAPAAEHPLMPALRIAHAGLAKIDSSIKDYSCTLVKRERIDGVLGDPQYIFLKVRHEPFSVYMYFLAPADVKGRECLYFAKKYDGKLVAHEGSGLTSRFGTLHLDPSGTVAMRGQKYPITEVGIRTLTARLIEVADNDVKYGECDVKFFKGAKIDKRECTMIQVMHPNPRKEFRFHLARVYVDDELQVPVRYEAYQWPQQSGEPPILDEEYTYINLKINNDFTDEDFSKENKNYAF